jgi:thiol-disulfide isomerase/thioredoxin
MALHIKIYGANCSKCNKLTERFREVVADKAVAADVEKITDTSELLQANIYTIPAVAINGKIVSRGVLLTENQIMKLLVDFLQDDTKIIDVRAGRTTNIRAWLFVVLILLAVASAALWSLMHGAGRNKDRSAGTLPAKMGIADSLDVLYNYEKNGQMYRLTFIEFGSHWCAECRKMEEVMDAIRQQYPHTVQLVFCDVRNKECRKICDHYEIQLIPSQVLLDRNGKVFFQHTGFISATDLAGTINRKLGI